MNDKMQEGETIYRKVSVKERLPDKNGKYFVICHDMYMESSEFILPKRWTAGNLNVSYWLEPTTHHRGSGGYGELLEWIRENKARGVVDVDLLFEKILSLSNQESKKGFSYEEAEKKVDEYIQSLTPDEKE